MLGAEMPLTIAYQQDGCSKEKRDPCSSPPCKRLKQAPITFPIVIDDPNEIKKPTSPEQEDNARSHAQSNVPVDCGKTAPMEIDTEEEVDSKATIKTTLPTLPPTFKTNDQSPTKGSPAKSSGLSKNSNSTNKFEKASQHTSPAPVNHNGILKFTQPVTPGHQPNGNTAITSPEDSTDKDAAPPTSTDPLVSPVVPTTPSQMEFPNPASTPINKPKSNTPKGRTPGRKLSVEEKLRREEEKLKKQKEREQLEHERQEKKKEKERIRMEKEKERQEAKQKKEQEKIEQLAQKKQREKERQEKKEQEDKEKRERLEKKEEEKRKREDEKRKKEEEKNLKNEEKRKREEEETLRKQKAKTNFASFFIKKEMTTTTTKQKEPVKAEAKFQPFELKPFMKLASNKPIKPLSQDAKETLNRILTEQTTTSICCIKEELQKIRSEVLHQQQIVNEATSNVIGPNEDDGDDEIMIVEDALSDDKITTKVKQRVQGVKPKLLQFHDNYRPAYFGTWRKKSSCVGPRGPFKKDMDFINYDVDSDEEWEEEEPGESLSNSEGEDEDKDEDENDPDNDGFFVPHGYLSDDEGVDDMEEDENENMESGNTQSLPQNKDEDRMQRQLAKQKAWETEMKRQCKQMKPIAVGCIWAGEIPSLLKQLEACCLVPKSIDPGVSVRDIQQPGSPCSAPSTYCNTAMLVPEEAMPALIKLVHGSMSGLHKLMQLFRKKWTLETNQDNEKVSESTWEEHCMISKRQLERRITTMAKKERRSLMPKARWYVHESILAQYKMENISLPNDGCVDNPVERTAPSNKVNSFTPNIKQFAQNSNNLIPGQNVNKILVKPTEINNEELIVEPSPV